MLGTHTFFTAQRGGNVQNTLNPAPQDEPLPEEIEPVPNRGPEQTFDPAQCLFCPTLSIDSESNIVHMSRTHSFKIPELDRLLVDIETLISYLHLIISTDFECLHCGAQRRSSEAVRQHMIAKGHCKIDITDPDSEFRDFYEASSSDGEEEDGEQPFHKLDETTLRLSSGKPLYHKDYSSPRRRRKPPNPPPSSSAIESIATDPPSTSTLTSTDQSNEQPTKSLQQRVEKRAAVLDKRMAQLRATDVRSLSHLPPSQQHAQLLVQMKQMDSVRRAQRMVQHRVQMKGNQTLMKHFVNDVPGPPLG